MATPVPLTFKFPYISVFPITDNVYIYTFEFILTLLLKLAIELAVIIAVGLYYTVPLYVL